MSHLPIVLLHGALGSKEQLAPLSASLSPFFETYSLSFEGHGGIESTKDFSMALFAENLLSFLENNALQKVHLFGYSMGGYVALQFAKNNPERVGNIITLGTKFNWTPEIAEKEVKMLRPDVIEHKVPKFAQMLENIHAPCDWKKMMQKTATMMIGLGGDMKLKDVDFAKISHRVLIIVGSEDHMVSTEESKYVAALLPNGKTWVADKVPHAIEKTDPAILVDLITNHINK